MNIYLNTLKETIIINKDSDVDILLKGMQHLKGKDKAMVKRWLAIRLQDKLLM